MAQYEIKKTDGTAAGTAELADAVYGIEPNIPVIHQVIVCQDACLRQGTHATKNRHDVSGGGKKPYRQKGTGRARQGSTRAGQWKGGGVIFGPMPHSHAKRISSSAHPNMHRISRRCGCSCSHRREQSSGNRASSSQAQQACLPFCATRRQPQ